MAEKLRFEHVARGHNPEPKPNTSGDGQIWGSPRGKNNMSNMSDSYHFLLGNIFNLKCSLLGKRWSYRGQSHLKSNHKSCTTLRHHLVPFPKYGRGKGSKLTLLNEGEGGLEETPPPHHTNVVPKNNKKCIFRQVANFLSGRERAKMECDVPVPGIVHFFSIGNM